MIDCHIHIERGTYSLNWIDEFVHNAVDKGIGEIWLLEHCYRFREFLPMYDSVCAYSEYINNWFHQKAGILELADYLRLIDHVRQGKYPVNIKFGLEVCYFKEFEDFVYNATKGKGLDFLVGSVHFVDDFAYDHKSEHWVGVDVDKVYRRYFETSIELAKSGIYDGIAHPDCIKLFGFRPSYSLHNYYEELAKSLAKSDMYAEQNGGAYRRCPECTELGMNEGLIMALKSHGVRIQTASDAHSPEDVGTDIYKLEKIVNEVRYI